MLKMLSLTCGGKLTGKEVARDCLGALCAILTITVWGMACFVWLGKLGV